VWADRVFTLDVAAWLSAHPSHAAMHTCARIT
jgi:hypothetical protein